MYVIRRIAKAQPGKVWQVANLLIKICAAYEEKGRPKAHVYVSQGMPGTPNVAYAEWTQATIEPNWPSQVPEDSERRDAGPARLLRAGHTGEASREGRLIEDHCKPRRDDHGNDSLPLGNEGKPQKPRRNPVALAKEGQSLLDQGEVPSPAALSRRFGVSRAPGTGVLGLLHLSSEKQKEVLEVWPETSIPPRPAFS